MSNSRKSGVLLHPTSLPGTPGIGTIGQNAYKFVDWLVSAKQSLWQILPIGPTGYGDSPYASFSTFAGNPLLIDLYILNKKGYLSDEQIVPPDYIKNTGYIDFGSVVWWKIPVLKLAAKQFLSKKTKKADVEAYEKFIKESSLWLDSYALFMSIKDFYDAKAQKEQKFGAMWSNYWPKSLATAEESAITEWKEKHENEINVYKAIQFFFFTQWNELKKYANDKGVSIIGDIPIFVSPDSADVWANQHLFQLDKNGRPKSVAGVPPDYFCATGQLWGNPLYDWKAMKAENYKWWIDRIKAMLSIVDYVRIDHFRGFEAYWSVPAKEETAINGKWIKGPDHDLFKTIKKELGSIPIIAEDLGIITDEVAKLRDDFELPGMRVLQFAFNPQEVKDGACVNSFLPHMYDKNTVVYIGTHDNDTARGWLETRTPEEKEMIRSYLGNSCGLYIPDDKLIYSLIHVAFSSVAQKAVFMLQDIYNIDSSGRMNTPATAGGHNWQWRMSQDMLEGKMATEKAEWFAHLSVMYSRN